MAFLPLSSQFKEQSLLLATVVDASLDKLEKKNAVADKKRQELKEKEQREASERLAQAVETQANMDSMLDSLASF